MNPGTIVLPDTSTRTVSAAGLTDVAPLTASMRPFRMTTVARSRGARPVPSITRAPDSTTVPPVGACASGDIRHNAANSTVVRRTPARRVEVRAMLRSRRDLHHRRHRTIFGLPACPSGQFQEHLVLMADELDQLRTVRHNALL